MPLQGSTNAVKNDYPYTTHTFLRAVHFLTTFTFRFFLTIFFFFYKINQTAFFRKGTLTSQNRPKVAFLWQPSKKQWSFGNFTKLHFWHFLKNKP